MGQCSNCIVFATLFIPNSYKLCILRYCSIQNLLLCFTKCGLQSWPFPPQTLNHIVQINKQFVDKRNMRCILIPNPKMTSPNLRWQLTISTVTENNKNSAYPAFEACQVPPAWMKMPSTFKSYREPQISQNGSFNIFIDWWLPVSSTAWTPQIRWNSAGCFTGCWAPTCFKL